VKSGLIGDEYYSIRGFDVSWISNFFNEREFLVYDAILPIRQNIIVDQNDTDKQARYIPLSTVYV
jgi:activator of HSP90 ATPase